MKILISGATGLIGSHLKKRLENKGHQILSLTRRPKASNDVHWDPKAKKLDLAQLQGIDGLIHLAGENIADARWTDEKKKSIYSSRVDGTRFLADQILKLDPLPKFFISASAVGYFGDRGDEILNESSPAGSGFLAEVCKDWEAASSHLIAKGVRVSYARIGIVLTPEGGALQKMIVPFKMGLGGPLGSGEQWLPWIDFEDLLRAFEFLVENEKSEAAYHFVAPNPLRQKDFATTLANHFSRPSFFKAPKTLIQLALGEMGNELLLASMRAIPERLESEGFKFKYAELKQSLKHLLD